jgi:hypothetical protein
MVEAPEGGGSKEEEAEAAAEDEKLPAEGASKMAEQREDVPATLSPKEREDVAATRARQHSVIMSPEAITISCAVSLSESSRYCCVCHVCCICVLILPAIYLSSSCYICVRML